MVELRPYQLDAVQRARAAIKGGAKNVLICAPTGAGKTVIASHLVHETQAKGNRCNFVVDRLSLINQTSETFDRYDIDHGVIQSSHPRFRPSKLVQLCSIQTVARRRWPESALDIIDEAHSVNETTKARITPRERITIGLTATPFTKGLGKLYDAVVNVTTTNQLIADGFLSPYRIFSCAEPNMDGVKVVAGEFEEAETAKRSLQVVGDVVQEYLTHGEDRKFICSAVNTAHVEELARQFLAAGISVATYTYRDKEEDRADTVTEFRKPDSTIRGLITVTAASKGFDVPDIACVIMARPLRKSLAEHIQFFGRGLRIADGKKDCLILDHSGNCARFWDEWNDFFEFGANELDDGTKKKPEKKKPREEAQMIKCPECGHLHIFRPHCPSCGYEYPKKKSVEHAPGSLKELVGTGDRKRISAALWPQIVTYARDKRGDAGRGMALALYKQITGTWPVGDFESTKGADVTPEVAKKIRALNIAYVKGKQAARQREQQMLGHRDTASLDGAPAF